MGYVFGWPEIRLENIFGLEFERSGICKRGRGPACLRKEFPGSHAPTQRSTRSWVADQFDPFGKSIPARKVVNLSEFRTTILLELQEQ